MEMKIGIQRPDVSFQYILLWNTVALKLAALKVFFQANTDSISMFSAYDDVETLLKWLTNWYNLYVSDLWP